MLLGSPAWAASPNCAGLLTGPRVRNFIKATKSPYSIVVYELNRPASARFVSLEAASRPGESTLSLHFVEPTREQEAHARSFSSPLFIQYLFANAFRRRAWLLAAALRDADEFTQIEFAWDGDNLNWLDFQDNRRTPKKKWLSHFMALRGFREEVFDVNIPPEERARDGSLIRTPLEAARRLNWRARSVYRRRTLSD